MSIRSSPSSSSPRRAIPRSIAMSYMSPPGLSDCRIDNLPPVIYNTSALPVIILRCRHACLSSSIPYLAYRYRSSVAYASILKMSWGIPPRSQVRCQMHSLKGLCFGGVQIHPWHQRHHSGRCHQIMHGATRRLWCKAS